MIKASLGTVLSVFHKSSQSLYQKNVLRIGLYHKKPKVKFGDYMFLRNMYTRPGFFIRAISTREIKRGDNISKHKRASRNIAEVFAKLKIDNVETKSELESALMTVNNYPKSIDEWHNLYLKALAAKEVTEQTFDLKAMYMCCKYKKFAAGKALLDYVYGKHQQPSVALLSVYMKLCGECIEDAGEELIIKTYQQLNEITDIFNGTAAEHIISGLSVTSQWKECFKLLEMISVTCRPSSNAYDQIIRAAFRNKEYDFGWQFIDRMMSENKVFSSSVCLDWLQICLDTSKTNKAKALDLLMKFLMYCQEKAIALPIVVADKIKVCFRNISNEQWESSYPTINRRGICPECDVTLKQHTLSEAEFNKLQKVFLQHVIVGKDIFLKTTPEEFEEFKKFVAKTSPYDIVVDALNIAYAFHFSKASAERKAKQLYSVIKYLVEVQNKKVFLIGRQHMLKWPKMYISYLRKASNFFIAQNISKDDPFFLYAAMYSGPGTYFISRDFMRDHAFALADPEVSLLFRRWQLCYQLQFFQIEESGEIKFKPPLLHQPVVQQTEDTWHIPCVETVHPEVLQEPPKLWLCLKKSSDNSILKLK